MKEHGLGCQGTVKVLVGQEPDDVSVLVERQVNVLDSLERDDDLAAASDVILVRALGTASRRGEASLADLLLVLVCEEIPGFARECVVVACMARKSPAPFFAAEVTVQRIGGRRATGPGPRARAPRPGLAPAPRRQPALGLGTSTTGTAATPDCARRGPAG